MNTKTANFYCWVHAVGIYFQVRQTPAVWNNDGIVLKGGKSDGSIGGFTRYKAIGNGYFVQIVPFCIVVDKVIQVPVGVIFRQTRKPREDRKIFHGGEFEVSV